MSLFLACECGCDVDSERRAELFEQLNELRDGRTSIYISHRFGRFNKEADLVLYMFVSSSVTLEPPADVDDHLSSFLSDGGKIIEQGSHAELMLRGGRYEELYAMAASAFIDDAK